MITTYEQTCTKFSCRDGKELVEELNKLNAVGNMPMVVRPTTPDATDTFYWYYVNYWIKIGG